MNELVRCKWCNNNPLLIQYHDHEWGQILKSNTALFEALTLEVFQAGLKWGKLCLINGKISGMLFPILKLKMLLLLQIRMLKD